jgi:hypothetical protein
MSFLAQHIPEIALTVGILLWAIGVAKLCNGTIWCKKRKGDD